MCGQHRAVTGFINGGGPTLIYGYIFCFIGSLAMCASISEMASIWPTSGGQYHWVALLAPPKWSRFLSWLTGSALHTTWTHETDFADCVVGWVSVLGWQAGCASGTFLGGTIVSDSRVQIRIQLREHVANCSATSRSRVCLCSTIPRTTTSDGMAR
jgi:amino acid transporter